MGVFERFERQKQEVDKVDGNGPNKYINSNIIEKIGQNGYLAPRAQSTLSTKIAKNEDLVDRVDSLPNKCPLKHSQEHPKECRFEKPLLHRMVTQGVLPDSETGCPIRRVCKLPDGHRFGKWVEDDE